MKYIIIPIAIILIFLAVNQKDSNIQTLNTQDTILAFGDSLTYGYRVNRAESYPSKLASLTGHTVLNEGINGDTSTDGLQRLEKILNNKSIKLMILCLGANDIIQRQSMSVLKSNLKTMIQLAKANNIQVLLISVPSFGLLGLTPLSLYEEVAVEENVSLASGILTDILSQPSLKIDQVHPNALGYTQIAEKIHESLKENDFVKH